MIGGAHGPGRASDPIAYRGLLTGFVLSLSIALLTLVDFRRGFLFAEYPARSLFYAFNPLHAAMLAAGIAGMFACHRRLRTLEAHSAHVSTSRYIPTLTLIVLTLLVIDLFAYRGVRAALLVVLPAISLPCMMLLGGSLQRFRLVAGLSAAVTLVGVVAGVMFL